MLSVRKKKDKQKALWNIQNHQVELLNKITYSITL